MITFEIDDSEDLVLTKQKVIALNVKKIKIQGILCIYLINCLGLA